MWPTREEKLEIARKMPTEKLLNNLIYWTEVRLKDERGSDLWNHDNETVLIIKDELLKRSKENRRNKK